MRTTLNVDDSLLRRAKQRAATSGRTLTAVVEDALRIALDEPAPDASEPFKIVPFRGKGLRVKVDLDDNEAVRDLLDGL